MVAGQSELTRYASIGDRHEPCTGMCAMSLAAIDTLSACRSKAIQKLKVAMVLMKVTEPWSDQYYQLDMEQLLRDNGFDRVTVEVVSLRHRTVLGAAA